MTDDEDWMDINDYEVTKCAFCNGEDEDLIKAKSKKMYQCKNCRTVFIVGRIVDKGDQYELNIWICSGKYSELLIKIPNKEKRFKLNDRGDIVYQED
jgi:predicted SprT family Zn-dependent metalloprotease